MGPATPRRSAHRSPRFGAHVGPAERFEKSLRLRNRILCKRFRLEGPSGLDPKREEAERSRFGSMATALVTAGAGFIGSHLSELLLEQEWEVYALDDLSTGSTENVAHLVQNGRFHLTVESVLSPSVVSELVHRCDAVYHLAAAVGVRLIVEQPGRTLLTTVQGAENVLDYCAPFEKPVLVASSSEVYGNHPQEVSLDANALRI